MASRRPVIKALLIDLSGTVHVDTQPITKSPHAIQRLRASSMPFRFCSNTSKESTAEVREKLAKMGIETRDNEVWTSYDPLNTAFRVLMGEHHAQRGQPRPDYPLIATHRTRYIGDSDGALSLGLGPFVAALENSTGRTAEIVGKPERKFFELVLNSFESDIQDQEGIVAVIGDDIQNDLGDGAVELGFWRVLGGYTHLIFSLRYDNDRD